MTSTDLRAWRAMHGMSKYRLAKSLGVSQSTVFRWERDQNPIPAWLSHALRGVECERKPTPDRAPAG